MHGSRQTWPRHRVDKLVRVGTALFALLVTPCVEQAWAADAGAAIVVTQLPLAGDAERQTTNTAGSLPASWGDGARIVLVTAAGDVRSLTDEFHSAADPDISFDGKSMLFAARRAAGDDWNIFEINLDGTGLRQITRDAGNCRSPVYQGTLYTLNSTEPWRHIAFVSDVAGERNEQGEAVSTSVYSCNLDGSSLRRLTMNPSSDIDPTVLPDGRLLFSSWQRSTLDRGAGGRVSLFASQSDGIDYALISGDEGQRVKLMPAVTTDRRIVFVESESVPWDGAGRLATVKLSRNLHSHRALTADADGMFHSPSPLRDGRILVSRRPGDGSGSHGVFRFDPNTGELDPIFDDPQRHDIQPLQVTTRPQPDGRSTVVSEDRPNGVLYGLDVYENDLGVFGGLPPGSAKRLRVLEGLPRHEAREDSVAPALTKRRILGEAPVHTDGSFNIEVPANVPVELQLLDEQGIALRSCSWIWVRNRETRGCIGCHEDGELTPPNRFVEALREESVALDPPPAARRTIDFRRDVVPVLTGTCASARCHVAEGVDPNLDSTVDPRRLYETLLVNVHPGRARTSPLIRHIHAIDTVRPWDADAIQGGFPSMPAHGVELVDDEARRKLIEWIDLGAAWDGTPADTAPRGEK